MSSNPINEMRPAAIDEEISDPSERARRECEALLNSSTSTFSTGKNLHLRGALTTVSILVRPDPQNPADCRIDVICQAVGRMKVDWERIPLVLVDPTTRATLQSSVLQSSGRATLNLPYGDGSERELGFRYDGVEMLLSARALALFGGTPGGKLPPPAKSDRILVEAKLVPVQTLRIEIRALDPSLKGSKVRVEIRSKKYGVLFSEEVSLKFGDGMLGFSDPPPEALRVPVGEHLSVAVRPH